MGKIRQNQNKNKEACFRLSEFTSITASLSDDEEDGSYMFERKASPSSEQPLVGSSRGAEDDIFGTILNKIVDHVKIGSTSSRQSRRNLSSKSDSSNDITSDTTEHRSNYSKRRLSIQVRRASDFLFSSHHCEEKGDDEAEEQHQWEVQIQDDCVDDWDL